MCVAGEGRERERCLKTAQVRLKGRKKRWKTREEKVSRVRVLNSVKYCRQFLKGQKEKKQLNWGIMKAQAWLQGMGVQLRKETTLHSVHPAHSVQKKRRLYYKFSKCH